MTADPLQQFTDKFGGLVPFFVLLGFGVVIAGLVLSMLVQAGENFIVRFIRSILHLGHRPSRISKTTLPPLEFEAPHCPSCNRVMVKRKARRGARVGEEFWGCTNYPECRGTRLVEM